MKTVDLSSMQKEKFFREQQAAKAAVFGMRRRQEAAAATKTERPATDKKAKSESKKHEIDEIYDSKSEPGEEKFDARRFNRPVNGNRSAFDVWKAGVLVLGFLLLGVSVYAFFPRGGQEGDVLGETDAKEKWYAVKLINDEVYYGQVGDIAADPIVIKNVYYNYDQLKTEIGQEDNGKLRLVKRGKETHGPSGTMNIIRSQVVIMEELGPESKVLAAILDYEK